ncbi:ead/Ea22-like family protein [Enterobacter hormaechei]|nr:ead/Ea22-like family protein [Enterobacter hormaechei]EKZ9451628.1 ead/Ea22-like family protein [Enterobacter hormaechei]ELC6289017.1 ead/Ea22-like family protein [Enterobacter hormaechei]
MSNIDKRSLREAAERAGADEWCAFIDTKSKTYSVHTPGDNRCGDVVKWAGFDGQQRAAAKAKFIAAANPATVLALLDDLEAKDKRIAELEARDVLLPPKAPDNLASCLDGYEKWLIATTFRDTWNACLAEVVRVNAAAGKGEAS